MATTFDRPEDRIRPVERERIVENEHDTGWAVAVLILIALIALGAYWWSQTQGAPSAGTPTETRGATINVTLPGSASPVVNATSSVYTGSLSGSSSASNTRSSY